jgi:hypothetical protein
MTRMLAPRPAFDARRSAPRRSGQMHRSAGFGLHLAVQRDGVGAAQEGATGLVRSVVSSPGQPLDPGVRSVMETRLGYDFSHVRVHTDEDAARSADAIGANAYTTGNHIVFGAGRFMPNAADGQRVVAHELAHVIQQGRGPVAGRDAGDGVAISHPEDPFERDAVRLAERAMTTPSSVGRIRAASAMGPDFHQGVTSLAVQRDAAGVIGAIAGIAAAIIAIGAWAWPRNPNTPGQGVTMNPNPFPLPTSATLPTKNPEQKNYREAAEKPPSTDKVLELRTDNDNFQMFILQRKTDGTHLISGMITAGDHKGYEGGYNHSFAAVNFSATQTAVGTGADKSKASSKTTATGAKNAPPPKGTTSATSSEDAPPTVDHEVVDFSGTNGESGKEPQAFKGVLLVKGDGTVSCTDCEVINNIGRAEKKGTYGLVDYRASTPVSGTNQSAQAAASASGAPGSEKQPPSVPPSTGAGK